VGKPAGVSMAGQKIRVHSLLQQGVKVAWRQHVNFEVHGICSVLQGKGDFAIQQVKVATTPQVGQSDVLSCPYFVRSVMIIWLVGDENWLPTRTHRV
jgi:hypothetical protein